MAQFARGPQPRSAQLPANAPHAALLIDFDNVTMGIRSDLTKELRSLLNTDVIKGKVAVQRAYADWRRYPQYIVPLAENSVDLIFAPAYGSSKKNATDIRLAIDALELVFTRPEIGTFILLSGDSDFSSLVLKLKEYGKYVIGVGIRESSSDLLVQNCDEYYSYSGLTGLTRAGDEVPTETFDPWELVEIAVRQMADNKEVMRSDRLKQILIELDPNFDEKALGFSKFNRFVQEAAAKGLLQLRKMENGQFEVAPVDAVDAAPPPIPEERARARRPERVERPQPEAERVTEEKPAARAETPPRPERPERAERAGPPDHRDRVARAQPPERAERPERSDRPQRLDRPDRGERKDRPEVERANGAAAAAAPPPAAAAPAQPQPAAPAQPQPEGTADLGDAYGLLQRATNDLTRGKPGPVRDSDVKRRMLELRPGFNEGAYGFSKFSRFLRQAHDAEVINLNKIDNGSYEVTLGEKANRYRDAGAREEGRSRTEPAAAAAAPDAETRAPESGERGEYSRRGRDRDRGRDRGRDREWQPVRAEGEQRSRETQLSTAEPAHAAPAAAAPVSAPATQVSKPAAAAAAPPPPASKAAAPTPAAAATAAASAAASGRTLGFRRGSRGPASAAPPPILPGQSIAPKAAAATTAAPASESARAETEPVATTVSEPSAPAAMDQTAIVERIAGYKGVGRKSAEAIVQAFGPDHVFQVLQDQPDRVRQMLGGRRAELLIKGFEQERANAEGKGAKSPRKTAAKRTRKGDQIEAFNEGGARKRAAKTARRSPAKKKTANKA